MDEFIFQKAIINPNQLAVKVDFENRLVLVAPLFREIARRKIQLLLLTAFR